MKLTPPEQVTVSAYDTHAKEFAQSRNAVAYWPKEQETFSEYLPSGRILEIGSGGGRDAKELIAAGYEYVGTDISQGLLTEARRFNPGVTFLKQSVYDLDFPNASFDGFWAAAVLLHIPKSRIDEALQRIRNVVKTGGIGFMSLKKGEFEGFVEGDHVGIPYKRFFAFYNMSEFTDILTQNNFEVLQSYETERSGKPWLVFFVKKR